MPDGRLIAGGDAALFVAHDDGASFVPLKYKAKADASFSAAITHQGAAYLGGSDQDLVRVD